MAVRFGDFMLQQELGTSDVAERFRAMHDKLGGPYFVKRYHGLDGAFLHDLAFRCERLMSVKHHALAPHLGHGEVDGVVFVVSPMLDGIDLASFVDSLRERRVILPVTAILYILREVALAVDALHRADRALAHGDVTARHIRLGPAGEVWLTGLTTPRGDGPGVACDPVWDGAGIGATVYDLIGLTRPQRERPPLPHALDRLVRRALGIGAPSDRVSARELAEGLEEVAAGMNAKLHPGILAEVAHRTIEAVRRARAHTAADQLPTLEPIPAAADAPAAPPPDEAPAAPPAPPAPAEVAPPPAAAAPPPAPPVDEAPPSADAPVTSPAFPVPGLRAKGSPPLPKKRRKPDPAPEAPPPAPAASVEGPAEDLVPPPTPDFADAADFFESNATSQTSPELLALVEDKTLPLGMPDATSKGSGDNTVEVPLPPKIPSESPPPRRRPKKTPSLADLPPDIDPIFRPQPLADVSDEADHGFDAMFGGLSEVAAERPKRRGGGLLVDPLTTDGAALLDGGPPTVPVKPLGAADKTDEVGAEPDASPVEARTALADGAGSTDETSSPSQAEPDVDPSSSDEPPPAPADALPPPPVGGLVDPPGPADNDLGAGPKTGTYDLNPTDDRAVAALLRRGRITHAQLESAKGSQSQRGGRLVDVLVSEGVVTETAIADILADEAVKQRISAEALDKRVPSPDMTRRLPETFASSRRILPLTAPADGPLVVAVADPFDDASIDEVRRIYKKKLVQVHVAERSALSRAIARAYGASASGPLPGVSQGQQVVLLCLDDDALLRRVGARFVDEGFAVEHAASGHLAQRILEKGSPDAVLCAYTLPGEVGGEDVLLTTRQSPQHDDTPFFMFGEDAEGELEAKVLDLGADDFFTAPYNLDVMVRKLRRAMGKHSRKMRPAPGPGAEVPYPELSVDEMAGLASAPVGNPLDDPFGAVVTDVPAEPTGVMGTLRQMAVSEIVQSLELGRKTARVELVPNNGDGGRFWFRLGQIVYAECGDLLGEEAFFALARNTQGFFRISYGDDAEETNIEKPTTFLLLEAMRRIDEDIAPDA